MSLSEKVEFDSFYYLKIEDVREAVKELKEKLIKEGFVSRADKGLFNVIIEGIFGEELV